MSNFPLVSIIAICYNHEKYVIETLDSILDQTYANIQLIIMDDCSSDNSVQVINDWIKEKKVECIFVPHIENCGLCKTLNEALNYVNGDYYQAISCDDILMPEKITTQLAIFDHYQSVAVVTSTVIKIDYNGKYISTNTEELNSDFGLIKSPAVLKKLLFKN